MVPDLGKGLVARVTSDEFFVEWGLIALHECVGTTLPNGLTGISLAFEIYKESKEAFAHTTGNNVFDMHQIVVGEPASFEAVVPYRRQMEYVHP